MAGRGLPGAGTRRRGLAILVACAGAGLGALAAVPPAVAGPDDHVLQGESGRLPTLDARTGATPVTAAQRDRARELGATARWNRFGTPRSLIRYSGALATGLGTEPLQAARRFLSENRVLFRLSAAEVDALEVVGNTKVGRGHTVLLRQRFGDLDAGHEGLIAVALEGDKAIYVTSSNTGRTDAPAEATLGATAAWLRAAASAGRRVTAGDVSGVRADRDWTTFKAKGLTGVQRVRLVGFPMYEGAPRAAYEAIVLDEGATGEGGPLAYTVFVDARTGEVLRRVDQVDFLSDNPRWRVFPANPRETYESLPPAQPTLGQPNAFYDLVDDDIRQVWCWEGLRRTDPADPRCDRVLFDEQPRGENDLGEWDRVFDPLGDNVPSFTTLGNNANTGQARLQPLTGGAVPEYKPSSPSRDYIYPWANQWEESKCNPSTVVVPGRGADIDAAIANLFAMHNRMHDWSYHLGFQEQTWNMQQFNFGRATPPAESREGDPEFGGAQAGAIDGGFPSYLGRDNANQITLNDGIPGVTNMYLWQPIQAAFYAPCVDGDYDMSVIGHEYTHAISNRMVAGPDGGLDGRQARSMGESWSDLTAVEYLNEYGLVPVSGENPFSVGSYVTGDKRAGIRNYGMNEDRNHLNWSDIGYDMTGPQVHADGEIWSATNYDIREALVGRYGAGTPASQERCANSTAIAVTPTAPAPAAPLTTCPGNRRWAAIMFAAWLAMQPDVDMADARDAYLAADQQLFGSRRHGNGPEDVASWNADLLWQAFARRGMGWLAENADSRDDDSEEIIDDDEADPYADFSLPAPGSGVLDGLSARNATVTFAPTAGRGRTPAGTRIFVGDFEARVRPVADNVPGADAPGEGYNMPATRRFAPGTYHFVATAPGYGHVRFTRTFRPGQVVSVPITMSVNVASRHNGATATGTGSNQQDLIDDTEDTQWLGTGGVEGSQVTVALNDAGSEQDTSAAGTRAFDVTRVRVSAMLRPALPTQEDPFDRDPSQSRFSALRQFEVLTCRKTATNPCTADANFTRRYTSRADAFPATRPRPRAPELIIRSFDIPDTTATHLRLRVLTNQCTGNPGYHGEQDSDPLNVTDCRAGSTASGRVFAAELQAIKSKAPF